MHTEYDVRMKENYEKRSSSYLTRRIPVIIRADGKSFHTFCKRFKKPYDEVLNNSLNNVMKYLCENIQGAKFAERHSDEISILVTDFDTITTDAYFDYNVQKICSIVASMATAEFCRQLAKLGRKECHFGDWDNEERILDWDEKWPNFDARCFNIPEHEVSNYMWWRMLDSKRGSINMTGQANFSHKELQGLTCDQIQEKLWQEKGINWAKLPQGQKIGFICERKEIEKPIPAGPRKGEKVMRSVWEVSTSPALKSELDQYIDKFFVKE